MDSASPSLLPDRASDRSFFAFTGVVSAAAIAFLTYILVIRRASGAGSWDLSFVPAVNACFNALSAVLLASGWLAIRSGRRRLHQYLMVSAFTASALFLIGYVAYHYAHGDTKFQGVGAIRAVYFAILISHVLLSLWILPGALISFWFAARGAFLRHRRIARITLPIWLYVSVTGVAIFFMLRGSR